jgi:hypothetical protein
MEDEAKPGGRTAGFTVAVTEIPGPGDTVAGTVLTLTQLLAAVTELILKVPPPVFWIVNDCESGAGLVLDVVKERSAVPTLSWGGASITVRVTPRVCELPWQGLEVHVSVTEPVYGDPPDVRESALLVSAMESVEGVVFPPLIVNQVAEGEPMEKPRLWEVTLEVTVTEPAGGTADVPVVMEKETPPEESTRSGELGRIVTLALSDAVCWGVDESVATMENV